MVAQAQFSTAGIAVQPGDTETISLSLFNIGNHTETYTLVPAGLLAGWVRLDPPTVTLFGGTSQVIEVMVRPPRLSSTPAGPAPLTIRIIPLEDPDDVIIAETTVIMGAFDGRQILLLQPVASSRRRAVFEFLVENQGNSQANCRLHLIDTSQRLDGDFDPAAVGIEPGGTSLVRLRMKAVHRQWSGGSRTIPFSIEADQQGFPTATANATFVQSSIVPDRVGRRAIGLILLAAALVAAWFGLIRPATRRAAQDAVRHTPGVTVVVTTPVRPTVPTTTTAPVVTTPGTTIPGQTTTTVVVPAATQPTEPPVVAPVTPASGADSGTLFSKRIELDVDPGASGQTPYHVPAGQELRVTDFVIQNTKRDMGLATVLQNDAVVFRWDLNRVTDNNDVVQLISPIVFPAGSTLVFKLDCTAPGAPGQCSEGLLVSGHLVTV
jgi:hypothetical protein